MAKMTKHRFRSNTLPAVTMVGPVTLWLAFFVAIPLLYVLVMSFCSLDSGYNVVFQFTLANYQRLLDPNYVQIYLSSILVAFLTTVICVAIGYPFSFLIARTQSKHKALLYMLVIIPFWTNSLIRIYGWRSFLGANGPLNQFLMNAGLASRPIQFLFNRGTTVLGMVYCLFPFMVLPLYTAIEKLDQSLLEASADLGAKKAATFVNLKVEKYILKRSRYSNADFIEIQGIAGGNFGIPSAVVEFG